MLSLNARKRTESGTTPGSGTKTEWFREPKGPVQEQKKDQFRNKKKNGSGTKKGSSGNYLFVVPEPGLVDPEPGAAGGPYFCATAWCFGALGLLSRHACAQLWSSGSARLVPVALSMDINTSILI